MIQWRSHRRMKYHFLLRSGRRQKSHILEANPLTRVHPILAEMAHAFVLEADVLHAWLPVYEWEKGD